MSRFGWRRYLTEFESIIDGKTYTIEIGFVNDSAIGVGAYTGEGGHMVCGLAKQLRTGQWSISQLPPKLLDMIEEHVKQIEKLKAFI